MKKYWTKLGLIFSVDAYSSLLPSWFATHAQAPNAVDLGEFVRVYFTCRPKIDADNQATSRGLYVDMVPEDGFKVLAVAEVPILDLGPVGAFDEHGTYPISVIKEGETFYAYYGGWSRNVNTPFVVSIGMATSEDGKFFKKYGKGPVFGSFQNDSFVVTSPKIRKFNDLWVLTYTCGEKWLLDNEKMEIIYKLKIAFSKDGINWDRNFKTIITPILGESEAQACGDIYLENGLYHMYFSYRAALDFRTNRNNSYKIGYAISKDLIDWVRHDDAVEFFPSSDEWDSEMMAYPNIFHRNGETYMLYLGNDTGKCGFGAARLLNV